MSKKHEVIENHFAYSLNAKKVKRISHKKDKQLRNRIIRHKIKSNPLAEPEIKAFLGWEY
jgi:hypothetical protein